MTSNGSSHQNLSVNGMNTGHSSNNGIINGSSGNITNGGFGTNSAIQTNAFTSGFAQSSNGISNNTNSGKGIILQNLIESNNLQDLMAINGSCGSSNGGWSNGDSHDSGMGSSPPFDGIRGSMGGSNGLSNGIGSNGMTQNGKPILAHQSSLPAATDGMVNQRGNVSGTSMGTSSLLWGELNKALGGLDLSSTTASNNSGANQMNQLQGNMVLNNELNKNQYTNVGARSSLDLGSLGRTDQSNSMGASALASQLLQHQQQNLACGVNGSRAANTRNILSDMDNTNIGCNVRGSSVLQQNLEELLQHQNQNIVRVPSSASSTSGISSSSPPESLQNIGSMMQNAATLLSSKMNENKSVDSDQTALDASTVNSASSNNEPENKSDEGRNGIIAI